MKSNTWLVCLFIAASLLHGGVTIVAAFSATFSSAATPIHSIDNVPCRELEIYVKGIGGSITVLEATLEGQEKLVDEVLLMDGDDGHDKKRDDAVKEDPYGSVLWPAASAVAEYITRDSFSNDEQMKTILELGTGTGLVALAASASNKFHNILATDYETVPLRLLNAAYHLNQQGQSMNNMDPIHTDLFDICDFSMPLPQAELVCAADILYEKKTGIALAKRTIEALERGSRVVIGCSPGRPGRPIFLEELQRLHPNLEAKFVSVEGSTCTGERASLICGEGSTSVSDEPELLMVALMDLTPDCWRKATRD